MSLDFVSRAIIAGIGIAIVAGPLGSIMVWRRMANFGDALAHSTLLGLCFALLLNIHVYIGLISICILISSFLALLSYKKELANDTILSILAYTTLAVGLILATLIKGVRIDLLAYLYGDILSVDHNDLLWIYGVDVVSFITLIVIWRSIVSITVHEDLAKVEGVPVNLIQWTLVLLMAIVFAVAMKLVGILLMTGLLIIPAAGARSFARTPEQMAILASLFGVVSVCLGIFASYNYDWPAGPAIVVVASAIFFCSIIGSKLYRSAFNY